MSDKFRMRNIFFKTVEWREKKTVSKISMSKKMENKLQQATTLHLMEWLL